MLNLDRNQTNETPVISPSAIQSVQAVRGAQYVSPHTSHGPVLMSSAQVLPVPNRKSSHFEQSRCRKLSSWSTRAQLDNQAARITNSAPAKG